MSSEQEEWDRAAKAGRRSKRPLVFALLAAIVVTAGGFGVAAILATDMQDRADKGEVVYEQRGPKSLFAILALPVVAGAIAFLGVFKVTGGKLPDAYAKALRR